MVSSVATYVPVRIEGLQHVSQPHGLTQARVSDVGVALEVGQERVDIGRQPRELVPEAREVGVGVGEGVDVLGLGDQVRCQIADDAADIGLDVLCTPQWDLFSTVCPPGSVLSQLYAGGNILTASGSAASCLGWSMVTCRTRLQLCTFFRSLRTLARLSLRRLKASTASPTNATTARARKIDLKSILMFLCSRNKCGL